MEPAEIDRKLQDPAYVAKIIIRGDPQVSLPEDPDEADQCRAAREIVRLYQQERTARGYRAKTKIRATLGARLREYVTAYGDIP